MKSYPQIWKWGPGDLGRYAYAFDKLDGSNIRAEWGKKRGFYKFGTRHCMLGEDHKFLGSAPGMIKKDWEPKLAPIFAEMNWTRVVCFFEFWGPNSFAGNHDPNDPKFLSLIDVNVHLMGMVQPKVFIELFQHLDIPQVLYHGVIDQAFVDQVESGQLPGMTFEGVVCKNGGSTFKVKNQAWKTKLREFCKEDDALYERLV